MFEKKMTPIIGNMLRLLLILTTITHLYFCSQSSKVNPPDGSPKDKDDISNIRIPEEHKRKYKKTMILLEKVIANQQHEIFRSLYLCDVIVAIATQDPEKGLELFGDIDTLYKGSNLNGLKIRTASALYRVLKGSSKHQLFQTLAKTDDKELASSVASTIRVSDTEDLNVVSQLVDPTSAEGSLILLLAAGEFKDKGRDWKKVMLMAKCHMDSKNEDNPFTVANQVYRAYLVNDIDPLKVQLKKMSKLSKNVERSSNILIGIILPLRLMQMRKIAVEEDHRFRYANYICEGSKQLSSDKTAFGILSVTVEASGEQPSACIVAQLKKRWNKQHLNGEVSFLHGAAFYAFKSMLTIDEKWATLLAEELIASLLAPRDSKIFYHMVGTITGILTRKNPKRAREIARQINSLEWYINALRCIYREWGKIEPKAAIASVKNEDFRMPDHWKKKKERVKADIMLEAIFFWTKLVLTSIQQSRISFLIILDHGIYGRVPIYHNQFDFDIRLHQRIYVSQVNGDAQQCNIIKK
jgi:hypothetical protein